MNGIKPMKKIMIVLCIFGLAVGGSFPLFAGKFIQGVSDKKVTFIIACYGAGLMLGVFGYYMIKHILMKMDDYYKKAILQKLGIGYIKESNEKQDLILGMKEEFDELLDGLAEMRKKEKDRLSPGDELDYGLLTNNPELIREEMLLNSATALAVAIDAKDSSGEKHSQIVSKYALLLGDRLNFSSNDRMALRIGGLLHDCGKMGIPDAIIQKIGALTDAEWRIIKNHTLAGSDIVKYISKTPSIDGCIRYHHERWDGRGYPDGLAGLAIPVHARIISIADAYHAMTADRPYRKALSQEQAFEELRNNRGTQFDPNLVETFIDSIKVYELQESA